MSRIHFSGPCWTRHLRMTIFSVFAVAASSEVLPAQEAPAPTVVRVEEDWVALIRNPDQGTSAPQIANVISPNRSTSGAFGILELNHNSFPRFREGGLQIQAWNGPNASGALASEKSARLHLQNDRVEYTVGMETTESGYRFGLLKGRSRSWGQVCSSPVWVSLEADNPTLTGYSPEFSVANTNVNVGAHRVEILYLRQTRYVYSDGSTVTDDTMRVLHRFQELVQDVSIEDYDQNPSFYNIEITETDAG
ncbi:MAG: hypothetical protein KDA96_20225 [Planctomycetaceae bacterium]|nr:hypothetical protein [Planctomycetaceae bacterium]